MLTAHSLGDHNRRDSDKNKCGNLVVYKSGVSPRNEKSWLRWQVWGVEAWRLVQLMDSFMKVCCYREMKVDCNLSSVACGGKERRSERRGGDRNGLGAGGLRKFAYTAYCL